MLHDATNDKLTTLGNQISATQDAIDDAVKAGRTDTVGILRIDLQALSEQLRRTEAEASHIAGSSDALAGDIAAAGLDMTLSIVEEHRPERPTHSSFVLVLVAVVVGTGSFIGAATLLGAFDSRVHDTDDVVRLGLPVLGHVPGFAGDNVGSMQARSAVRARVPSLLRWRSHR
jgi:capsular polysaccharide biosynthesis protein